MITLTLANWLEQRPRAPKEYQFVIQEQLINSKDLMPETAYQAFLKAYRLLDK